MLKGKMHALKISLLLKNATPKILIYNKINFNACSWIRAQIDFIQKNLFEKFYSKKCNALNHKLIKE